MTLGWVSRMRRHTLRLLVCAVTLTLALGLVSGTTARAQEGGAPAESAKGIQADASAAAPSERDSQPLVEQFLAKPGFYVTPPLADAGYASAPTVYQAVGTLTVEWHCADRSAD